MSDRQDAAVRYARAGWPVFPCKPDAKEPATKHGVLDAETDARTVTRRCTGADRAGRRRRARQAGPQEPQ